MAKKRTGRERRQIGRQRGSRCAAHNAKRWQAKLGGARVPVPRTSKPKGKATTAKKRKESSRGRKQDRARVAGGQKYEVRYEAKKTGKSKKAVKRAVKKVGNSRKKVERELSR